MQNIYGKLSKGIPDLEKLNCTFVLVNDNTVNATSHSMAETPLFFFNTGLLKNINEDQLALILSHELSHYLSKRSSSDTFAGGKYEEQSADLNALKLAKNAGYNIDEGIKFFTNAKSEYDLAAIEKDDHPMSFNREVYLKFNNALSNFNDDFDAVSQISEIPDEIKNLLSSEENFDQYTEKYNQEDFKLLSPLEKLKVIENDAIAELRGYSKVVPLRMRTALKNILSGLSSEELNQYAAQSFASIIGNNSRISPLNAYQKLIFPELAQSPNFEGLDFNLVKEQVGDNYSKLEKIDRIQNINNATQDALLNPNDSEKMENLSKACSRDIPLETNAALILNKKIGNLQPDPSFIIGKELPYECLIQASKEHPYIADFLQEVLNVHDLRLPNFSSMNASNYYLVGDDGKVSATYKLGEEKHYQNAYLRSEYAKISEFSNNFYMGKSEAISAQVENMTSSNYLSQMSIQQGLSEVNELFSNSPSMGIAPEIVQHAQNSSILDSQLTSSENLQKNMSYVISDNVLAQTSTHALGSEFWQEYAQFARNAVNSGTLSDEDKLSLSQNIQRAHSALLKDKNADFIIIHDLAVNDLQDVLGKDAILNMEKETYSSTDIFALYSANNRFDLIEKDIQYLRVLNGMEAPKSFEDLNNCYNASFYHETDCKEIDQTFPLAEFYCFCKDRNDITIADLNQYDKMFKHTQSNGYDLLAASMEKSIDLPALSQHPVEDKIGYYDKLMQYNLLVPNSEREQQFFKDIMHDISQTEDKDAQIKNLSIMLSPAYNLSSPKAIAEITSNLSDTLVEKFGIDDNSETYAQNVSQYFKEHQLSPEGLGNNNYKALYNNFAEKSEAQLATLSSLEPYCCISHDKNNEATYIKQESFFKIMDDNPQMSDDMVFGFLNEPYSAEQKQKFEKSFIAANCVTSTKYNDLEEIHDTFSNLSLKQKSAFMMRYYMGQEQTPSSATNKTLDALIPQNSPDKEKAKKLISKCLQNVPENMQMHAISVIAAGAISHHPENNNPNEKGLEKLGAGLKRYMEMKGPVETEMFKSLLPQLDMPQSLQKGYNTPNKKMKRSQAVLLAGQVLPKEKLAEIGRIKDVQSSDSLKVGLNVVYKDGKNETLFIPQQNIVSKVNNGLEYMEHIVSGFGKEQEMQSKKLELYNSIDSYLQDCSRQGFQQRRQDYLMTSVGKISMQEKTADISSEKTKLVRHICMLRGVSFGKKNTSNYDAENVKDFTKKQEIQNEESADIASPHQFSNFTELMINRKRFGHTH